MRELRAAGCERIFSEQVSSVAERPQLEPALDFVREGDSFTSVAARVRSSRPHSSMRQVRPWRSWREPNTSSGCGAGRSKGAWGEQSQSSTVQRMWGLPE